MEEPFSLIITLSLGMFGAAWLVTYVIGYFKQDGQRQTSAIGVQRPIRISLTAYLIIVAILSIIILTGDGLAILLVIFVVLPAAVIDLIAITIINKRYYRILEEQTGHSTVVKVGKSFNVLFYWIGLVAFTVLSTPVLFFGGILENIKFLSPLYDLYESAGQPLWMLLVPMPIFLLIYHGIISIIRKSFN